MTAMQRMMVWLFGCAMTFGLVAGCGPQTASGDGIGFNDSDKFVQSDSGVDPENDGNDIELEETLEHGVFDDDAINYPDLDTDPVVLQLTVNNTYHLPYFSGESFPPSTYNTPVPHGDAWDFNWAGSGDCGEIAVAIGPGRVEGVHTGCGTGYYGSTCGGGFGNHVRIDLDGDNNDYIEAHFDKVFVRQGQWVEGGQALGTIGTSGSSTGCHLHIEVRNSSNVRAYPQYVWNGGQGYLGAGTWYQSRQHSKIDAAKFRYGFGTIGNQTTPTATKFGRKGYKLEFTGGTFGNTSVYYEAWGCEGGTYCPSYNNTNIAWIVRGAIRSKYNAMGGPNSWLGFPTGDETDYLRGRRQNFRYGYLYWDRNTGVTLEYRY